MRLVRRCLVGSWFVLASRFSFDGQALPVSLFPLIPLGIFFFFNYFYFFISHFFLSPFPDQSVSQSPGARAAFLPSPAVVAPQKDPVKAQSLSKVVRSIPLFRALSHSTSASPPPKKKARRQYPAPKNLPPLSASQPKAAAPLADFPTQPATRSLARSLVPPQHHAPRTTSTHTHTHTTTATRDKSASRQPAAVSLSHLIRLLLHLNGPWPISLQSLIFSVIARWVA
ncbi:hypothetical protein LZ32DRAFT_610392 [Colletotrichum eremochloae]|nr:hypothetical protein LZ32DRAFT_610392 [Colletotrichum eremochloae]